MAHSPEIIERARELYSVPNKKGQRKYSIRQIGTIVGEEVGKFLSPQTISNWAKKYNWDKLWRDAAKMGLMDTPSPNVEYQTFVDRTNGKTLDTNKETDEDGVTQEERMQKAVIDAIRQRRYIIVQQLNTALRYYAHVKRQEEWIKQGLYIPKDWREAQEMYKFNITELKEMEPQMAKEYNIKVEHIGEEKEAIAKDIKKFDEMFMQIAKERVKQNTESKQDD